MDKRKVFIRHEPNVQSISVRYFEREKYQRHCAAGFYDKDHTIESVAAWVRKQPQLELVCAISGKPI